MRLALTLFFLGLIVSCKQEKTYTNLIKEDVEILADDAFAGRQVGTEGEISAGDYVAERFKELGLEPAGDVGYFQTFSFKPKTDPHQEIQYTIKDGDSVVSGRNVIGFMDNGSKNTVVIGAHYDHLGLGAEGSLYRGETQEIHNGADDNASGVAVMLDLVQRLKGNHKKNNYLFIAFSAEEMGLLGSNFFAKNSTHPVEQLNYMINMDMVGRLKADSTLAVYGTGTSARFKQAINSRNTNFKIIEHESGIGPSDHTSFYNINIPVLHFFTGQHEDYHKPSDDSHLLNYEGMEMISEYIFNVISELDKAGKLAFKATKNESEEVPRFKVGLGVIPDYLFDGKGMRIDGVTEGRPGQKAGLQKGDIVVKLGDSSIVDMMSYMRALSAFKEGDSTTFKATRETDTISGTIQF